MKRVLLVGLVVALVLAGGGAWYYYEGPCGLNVIHRATEELGNLEEWDDAYDVAASTSRISLAGPISDLQSAMRDVENLEVPGCLAQVKFYRLAGMDLAIAGFLSFMSQADDETVSGLFTQSRVRFARMQISIDDVLKCAPFCG